MKYAPALLQAEALGLTNMTGMAVCYPFLKNCVAIEV